MGLSYSQGLGTTPLLRETIGENFDRAVAIARKYARVTSFVFSWKPSLDSRSSAPARW